MTDDLAAWQQIGVLEPTADTGALALLFCGAAQVEAWADDVVGTTPSPARAQPAGRDDLAPLREGTGSASRSPVGYGDGSGTPRCSC